MEDGKKWMKFLFRQKKLLVKGKERKSTSTYYPGYILIEIDRCNVASFTKNP